MIHLVAQLCVLTEKADDFEERLRNFLRKEMGVYYESNRSKTNGKKAD